MSECRGFAIFAAVLAAVLASGCGGTPSPPPLYFLTCGDPVCRGYVPPVGISACTADQSVGAACGPEGRICDPVDACNRRLVCSREDPMRQRGGCPI